MVPSSSTCWAERLDVPYSRRSRGGAITGWCNQPFALCHGPSAPRDIVPRHVGFEERLCGVVAVALPGITPVLQDLE